MELLASFKNLEPEYDDRYFDMILDYTIEQGGQMGTQTQSERWKQGKYFSTRYEIYMYAAILGLKRNYLLPLASEVKKRSFLKIDSWKPSEVVDYIIMALFAKADFDFNTLENLEEKDVKAKLTKLRSLLESYANGGFDIIRAKREEDAAFFLENENCFLDLMAEN
jgi:hypothetical protein